MTETETMRRELLATRTELAQFRRLERVADSDLVRLALSAWAALAGERHGLARMIEDLPAAVSNQSRRTLRRLAKANLENARLRAALADYWALRDPAEWPSIDPDRVVRLRLESMVHRLKGWLLLEAAKEAR